MDIVNIAMPKDEFNQLIQNWLKSIQKISLEYCQQKTNLLQCAEKIIDFIESHATINDSGEIAVVTDLYELVSVSKCYVEIAKTFPSNIYQIVYPQFETFWKEFFNSTKLT